VARTPGMAEMSTGEETVRLLATLVRQNAATQADAIAELSKAGFGPTRIAELLGTTTGTAKVAVQRSRTKRSSS
jgi:DNA-directed RNA polymerase specialized sigma24 family protein